MLFSWKINNYLIVFRCDKHFSNFYTVLFTGFSVLFKIVRKGSFKR